MDTTLSPVISLLNAQMYVNISPFWSTLQRLSLPLTSLFTVICSDLVLKSTVSIVKSFYGNLFISSLLYKYSIYFPLIVFHNTG